MTPYYFCMTFKPSDALHSGLGFLSTKLVATGHFKGMWPLGDPGLTPAWPLTPAMSYTLIRGSLYQIWWPYGISKPFALWLTQADPLHDRWPQQCITVWSGVLPTKCGGHRALLSKLTPTWPQLTLHNLNPSNALHYGQGFFPPNLVAVGHY